ncbi:methyl-accepting chemotaxis protein [Curvibacter sp. HBC61]|uniref:Methyl-accepting chemotaxis protein n=1 Tax=Curvibacter cyanobacteriorum TaxID=3026422 RepID=A0ABT5MWD5_9BURK|nr:methyl-accepting chemotaxis protein [Curvibacter sp. HBC61]MDD0838330.1 methyl-accepting chemotaxis protein [Curvibacter sp. HBC61]
MLSSLRTKLLLITTLSVVVALSLTGAITLTLLRASTTQTAAQQLSAASEGNGMAIDLWVDAKATTVQAAANAVQHGDPQGIVLHMNKAGGFPVTTVGWIDKSYVSSSTTTPANYDPTVRPWYKAAAQAGKLIVTPPYADASTGVAFVSFAAPMLRDGKLAGVVSGAVPLDGVRQVVNAVHPTPNSLALLVTRSGQLLAHADPKRTLKPAAELSPALAGESLDRLLSATSPQEVELDGVRKWLQARAIRGTDWYLIVALDKADATQALGEVSRGVLLATVVLALLAAVLSSVFTARAFRRLAQVRDAMADISSGGGDLTQRLRIAGQDEVAQVAHSFNTFVDKMAVVLRDIRQGAESVRLASDEIRNGNQDLSSRTEGAASSLEQTSAALVQLTASVQQSAEATVRATQLASQASQAAAKGGEVVASAVSTMDEINQSSARISDIIGVIDGIAFQTNILALNAAVEAARAGENGRGFAVVAAEVRSLAQRSATAAKEIKGLISTSEERVSTGTQRVQAVGQTMDTIMGSILNVSQLIEEINGAMHEQSNGIGQISQAVAEMDRSTQQNAALVEESAAAASVLNDQAHRLAQTVGAFQLGDTPSQGTALAGPAAPSWTAPRLH